MGIEVKLPELADGVESADILSVLVKPGESLKKNQGVVEIETDKATAEIPTPQAGTVTQVHVSAGQTVKVGAVLVTLEAQGTSSGSAPAAAPPASQQPAAHGGGDSGKTAQGTPPAPPTAAQPATNSRKDPPAPVKKSVQPVAPSASAASSPSAAGSGAATSAEQRSHTAAASRPPVPDARPVAAGPAIRRFAREVGVDLGAIQGTGEAGRITREDVLEMVRRANRTASQMVHNGNADEVSVPGEPSNDDWGPISIEPATRIRRTIAAKMHESWSTVPRVTNFDDADVTELDKIREASRADYASRGLKLTSMPFLIKAVSMALRNHPLMNSTYDMAEGTIVYKRYVSIGVAMDTERGLVVPALRNTDQLSISEIARELSKLVDRIRENEFSVDDLRGGTFSISNLGAIGGTYSTPIVNFPEVAILLVGRSRKMPVVLNDQIAIRLMMPLSLSYDHRIIDGGTAARFLNDLISYLEEPGRLLLAP